MEHVLMINASGTINVSLFLMQKGRQHQQTNTYEKHIFLGFHYGKNAITLVFVQQRNVTVSVVQTSVNYQASV